MWKLKLAKTFYPDAFYRISNENEEKNIIVEVKIFSDQNQVDKKC